MLVFRIVQGNIADNGDIGKSFNVGASFDAVAQQVQYVDDGNRNTETEHKCHHVNFFALGRYGEIICQRIVDDFGVIGGGGKCNIIFLSFLQQHEIESRLDFLLALDADKATFLGRSVTDASGVLACLTVEVGFGDKQSFAYTGDGCEDAGTHVLYVAFEAAYNRVGFRRGTQQTVTFQNQRIVLSDEPR